MLAVRTKSRSLSQKCRRTHKLRKRFSLERRHGISFAMLTVPRVSIFTLGTVTRISCDVQTWMRFADGSVDLPKSNPCSACSRMTETSLVWLLVLGGRQEDVLHSSNPLEAIIMVVSIVKA